MSTVFDDAASARLIWNVTPVTAAPLTFACWGFTDAGAGVLSTMISITDTSEDNEFFSLYFDGDNTNVRFRATSFFAGDGIAITTTSFSTNTWHHCCGVARANNSRDAYIDGGSKGSGATLVTPINLDTIGVGIRPGSPNNDAMSGRILWPAIWNAALTDEEVQILANGTHPYSVRGGNLVWFASLHQTTLANNESHREIKTPRTVDTRSGTGIAVNPPGVRYTKNRFRTHSRTDRTLA